MKKYALALLALAMALAITPKASADPITGVLNAGGTLTQDPKTHDITSIRNIYVDATSTGDFAALAATAIVGGIQQPEFNLIPGFAGQLGQNIIQSNAFGWGFILEGYTFENPTDIQGWGMMLLNDHTATRYNFDFTFQGNSPTVTFSATAITPEPSSLLLLGSGLLGLALLIFRRANSSPRLMLNM